MKLESLKNSSFKTYTVAEILVFKVRLILQFSQKEVRKVVFVSCFISFSFSDRLIIFSGFITLDKLMQINRKWYLKISKKFNLLKILSRFDLPL